MNRQLMTIPRSDRLRGIADKQVSESNFTELAYLSK